MRYSNFIIYLLISCVVIFSSCDENEVSNREEVIFTMEDASVAVNFINGYIEEIDDSSELDLLNKSTLVSRKFIKSYKRFVQNYEKEYDVLDFDPILNGQDYPDEGFELIKLDSLTGFLIVRGKEWKDFQLSMKIIKEKGTIHIDGSGVVNIPNDKIVAR